ncbi:urease accessory protein UreD [Neomegalonema sp.]|uniref:urease accessory protein UreD n=1 Tax=Neomegalonema sp. TaxID=2039713 RepID=UPI00260E93F2|nr:urease accessory protein UreD [Neomegalonema sp.]MDD2869268.1 urease accessory protein UreD [Neomegalonema sp.]
MIIAHPEAPARPAPGRPAPQRAEGVLRLALKQEAGRTRPDRIYQEGCAKVRLVKGPLGATEAEPILINSSGGLTGGDRFSVEIELGPGAEAMASTQACERIYRASGGEVEIRNRLRLGPGARLDWLPQETILFDGAALSRSLEADLAPDSEFLAVEAILFGRKAMGETLTHATLRDRWRIRQGGRLLHAEDLRLEGPVSEILARASTLRGGAALATLLHVGRRAESLLEPLREILGAQGGASFWRGRLLARLTAPDGLSLRRRLEPALTLLRGGRPLSRLWRM